MAFYVTEYNGKIPHAAFRGQTPDEMYYDRGERIPVELEAARKVARAKTRHQSRRALRALPEQIRSRRVERRRRCVQTQNFD